MKRYKLYTHYELLDLLLLEFKKTTKVISVEKDKTEGDVYFTLVNPKLNENDSIDISQFTLVAQKIITFLDSATPNKESVRSLISHRRSNSRTDIMACASVSKINSRELLILNSGEIYIVDPNTHQKKCNIENRLYLNLKYGVLMDATFWGQNKKERD